jgi:hypothetical protein
MFIEYGTQITKAFLYPLSFLKIISFLKICFNNICLKNEVYLYGRRECEQMQRNLK